jgi:hypothetical protein
MNGFFVSTLISAIMMSHLALGCTIEEAVKIGKDQVKASLRSYGVTHVRFNSEAMSSVEDGVIFVEGQYTFNLDQPGYIAEHVGSYRVENCQFRSLQWGTLSGEEATQ